MKTYTNEMWAAIILLIGVGVLVLTWHSTSKGDTAIAAGIIGAALNKFQNKAPVPPEPSTPPVILTTGVQPPPFISQG